MVWHTDVSYSAEKLPRINVTVMLTSQKIPIIDPEWLKLGLLARSIVNTLGL